MAVTRAFLSFALFCSAAAQEVRTIAGAVCAANCLHLFGRAPTAPPYTPAYRALSCSHLRCQNCLLPCHSAVDGRRRCNSLCSRFTDPESPCQDSCSRLFSAFDRALSGERVELPVRLRVGQLRGVCAEVDGSGMQVLLRWNIRGNDTAHALAFLVGVAKMGSRTWRVSSFGLAGEAIVSGLAVADHEFRVRVVDANGRMALSKAVAFRVSSEPVAINNLRVTFQRSDGSRGAVAHLTWRIEQQICRCRTGLVRLSPGHASGRHIRRTVDCNKKEIKFPVEFGKKYLFRLTPLWSNKGAEVHTLQLEVPSCHEFFSQSECNRKQATMIPSTTADPIFPLLFGQSRRLEVSRLPPPVSFSMTKNSLPPLPSKQSMIDTNLLLALTLPVLAVGVLIAVIAVYRLIHTKFSLRSAFLIGKRSPPDNSQDRLDPFETSYDRLDFIEEIGRGEFGIVHRALWSPCDSVARIDVAVKRLQPVRSGAVTVNQFLAEIFLMKRIGHHRNVVSLLACCTRPNKPLCLVMDYCKLGSLHQNLLKMEPRPRDSQQSHSLLRVAFDVASGMEYLSKSHFVHRDLACRNILLTNEWVAKVADFGLSRDVYKTSVYRCDATCRLPFRWLAPEALSRRIFSTASDVWAFGVVLWEIMTLGAVPFPNMKPDEILAALERGERLSCPKLADKETYAMMTSCWEFACKERPSFPSLCVQLEQLLTTRHEYLPVSIEGTDSLSSGYLQL